MNQFTDVINQAAKAEDHTKEQAMGKTIPAGVTIGRFVHYIELGPQPQEWNGKKKPDCEMVRITFELLHPEFNKNIKEDGSAYYDKLSCTIPKKFVSRAKFLKLMTQMSYGRDHTHMAQMLGEDFKITVFHHVNEDTKQTYASLFNTDFSPQIMAPYKVVEDDLGNVIEKKRIPTPEATVDLKCFIWSNPTMECWNSIYIDGTYKTKVDGKEVEKSANVNQERIMASPAFKGSAVEAMLEGANQLPGQDQLDSVFGPSDTANTANTPSENTATDLDDLGAKVAAQAANNANTANAGANTNANANPTSQPQTENPAGVQGQAAGQTPVQDAKSSTEVQSDSADMSGDDALAALGL